MVRRRRQTETATGPGGTAAPAGDLVRRRRQTETATGPGGTAAPAGGLVRRKKKRKRAWKNAWFAFLHEFAALDLEARGERPDLSTEQILAWADAYRVRHGDWPGCLAGPIPECPGETWLTVEAALSLGLRGFAEGSTVARLLAQHRGRYHRKEPPLIAVEQILAWADEFHARTGRWPRHISGAVPGAGGIAWSVLHHALVAGRCGLPGRSSLPRLLAAERGVYNHRDASRLTEDALLARADAHRERTGDWPRRDSGPIEGTRRDTWKRIDTALVKGNRGLPGGSSLARLLAAHRGVRNHLDLPPLRVEQVLRWADAHRERTGRWPHHLSGPIEEASGETWLAVESALSRGGRGLPGGSSLSRLLREARGKRRGRDCRGPTTDQVLAWADEWRARTGRFPPSRGVAIPGAGGLTWGAVDRSLREGRCGASAGSSLARLLASAWAGFGRGGRPLLSEDAILAWADAHRERTGAWPKRDSGGIEGRAPETWASVDAALRAGMRGLAGGSSLPCLLAAHRGVRNRKARAPRGEGPILARADAHHGAADGRVAGTRAEYLAVAARRSGDLPMATPRALDEDVQDQRS